MKATALAIAAAQCFAAAERSLDAGEGNERIRAALEGCLPGVALAMACYEETLWMNAFFASKANGISLERARRGYPAGFASVIGEVYASGKDAAAFRRDWFVDCVARP